MPAFVRPLVVLICAVVLLAVAGPAPAAAAGLKGFWGPSQVNGVSQFPVYERLGVDLYQTTLRWQDVAPSRPADPRNPSDPAYRWPAELDYVIGESKRHRMKVLLMIIGSPGWANGGKSPEWAPNPRDFADFAAAAAQRYGTVRHWMVWGEPSRNANFKPLTPQVIGKPLTREQAAGPRRYARLLDAAYGALKRVRRSNVVIGGNTFTAGDIRPANWVRHMRLPNGRPPRLDVYGHNPFCLRAPDLDNPPGPAEIADFSDLGRFGKTVNRHLGRRGGKRGRVPLFLSEWTVPTGPDRDLNFYTTRKTQATFIARGFRIARAVKAYGLGWVNLQDEPVPADGGRRRQSGLLDADGRPKPGFNAFRRGRL